MAKKLGLLHPTQLWGKPLPSPGVAKAKEKVTRKMTDEDVTDDDEIDVDAELADADEESEADADDDTLHAVEAEDDSEVTGEAETEEPEEDSEDGDEEPEYDGEDGDASDETEDETVEDDEVVTAVADDEETGDENPETTGKGSMSEKMSLSDHVRAEIARRQKSGDSLRGVEIVASLAKRKIEVSPAQVSQLLKKAGLGGKPRGKKTGTPVVAGATEKSRVAHKAAKREVEPVTATKPAKSGLKAAAKASRATNGFNVPMDQLSAAEAFVQACNGSFSTAQRILTAAEQLSDAFSG